MKTTQYRWSQIEGWKPNLPNSEAGQQDVIFVFGARSLIQAGDVIEELRNCFKGSAIIGCSTSGEIVGDSVIDDSVVATAVHFEHTRHRTASTTMAAGNSSYEVGEELARQLNDSSLRHVFVLSDGLKVNGSDLARGLASGVSDGVSITGGLSGDGTDFAETWVIDTAEAGAQRIAAIGLYGDHLRVGYGSMGGWKPFGPLRTITRAEGNVLYELDGEPALPLYKKYLGEHAKGLPATGLLFPLTIKRKGSDVEVREGPLLPMSRSRSPGGPSQACWARRLASSASRLRSSIWSAVGVISR